MTNVIFESAPLPDDAIAAAQADPDIGFVVDAPHADAPLIITFGFVAWDALPAFDFAGRTRKLEATTGQPINRILVRDTANFWYQHGVIGLGEDVDTTAAALREIIGRLGPSSVCTVGQSMGGYAAVLFGALLGADRVLAFGPLSYLRSDWARRDGDTRWLASMEAIERSPPPRIYDDLPALLAGMQPVPTIHVVYGTGPEADGTVNSDALHAARYRQAPGVIVHEVPQAPHAVVQWLIDNKLIDNVLRRVLLPAAANAGAAANPLAAAAPPQAPARQFQTVNDGWRSWISDNLVFGAVPERLAEQMIANGIQPAEAQREVDKANRSPYLRTARRLAQRVLKRDWTLEVQLKARCLSGLTGLDRRHQLDRESFFTEYYAANRPVVITGMIDNWPMREWTADSFAGRFSDRNVQVQTRRDANPRYEREAAAHEEVMAFGDFMARVGSGSAANDIYMAARNSAANAAELPELWDAIVQIPAYLDAGNPENRGLFWIGGAGTVTPTHHDLTNNLLAQVIGRKRVHLVNGLQVGRMYNTLHVYSDVDLEAIDYDRFPAMRDVEVLCVDLAPGELLFVPVGWWHHVRALDFSVSVTFTNFAFDSDFHSSYRTYGEV